ncbi:MAG: helix-turn-helix domain-containing protein [Acidiphilium sp.]
MPKSADRGAPTKEDGVAARLRLAVEKNGGASEVSRKSGVPISTLNDYLSGREPRFSRAFALARACGVSLDWLATGISSETSAEKSPNIPMFRDGIADEPANFWALFVPLRTCQEYHQQLRLRPTLHEVFMWISPLYIIARTTPDRPIEFKPPED